MTHKTGNDFGPDKGVGGFDPEHVSWRWTDWADTRLKGMLTFVLLNAAIILVAFLIFVL